MTMTRRTLQFKNPVFSRGLQLTCRKGVKWATSEIGTSLNIVETGTREVIGTGQVAGVVSVPFNMLAQNGLTGLLNYEHDPSCHTVEGLYKEMVRVYGEFDETDVVTLLMFYYEEA